MEFFTIFVIVTTAVFIIMAGMGIWATVPLLDGDTDIRNTRADNRRVEKLTREKMRHRREMSRIRRNRRNWR